MSGVFFFPGAGSFGAEFQALADAFQPDAWLIKYPGRFGRDFGVPAESFDGVVRACAEQIAGRATTSPILFGHSFGAYVAYATALRLQEAGAGLLALVLAGAVAPGRLEVSEQATGSLSDAARYLDSVDPSALAGAPSDDWREVVVETAVQDLRLLRQFAVTSPGGVRCPILAVLGDADPLTSADAAGEWKNATDHEFSMHVFPGGHSGFLRSEVLVAWAREVRARLTAVG